VAISEDAHRNLFGSIGGALAVAGVIISATWWNTLDSARPNDHLAIVSPVLDFGICVFVVGLYVIVAAAWDTKWLPLFGKTALRVGRAKKMKEAEVREWAMNVLVQASNQGRTLNLDPNVTPIDAVMWSNLVFEYVTHVWGIREGSLINNATTPYHLNPPGTSLHQALITPTIMQLGLLISRRHELEVTPEAKSMTKSDYDVWFFRFGGGNVTRTPTQVAGAAVPQPTQVRAPDQETESIAPS
jgi:hypothetical protein